jgi:3-deoxy-D-manno-octulosonic-acid transferase
MITFIYNFIILPLLMTLKSIIQPLNRKLKEREGMWEDVLEYFLESEHTTSRKRVWFHAASMGEFEQAKPVIEYLKSNYPDTFIIVSFYSPSGFNNQKDYKYADAVLYMPIDTAFNARYFINTIQADVAVFVRYEIWLNHLNYLKKLGTPTLLICATKPNSNAMRTNFFLRSYLHKAYSCFTGIYTINQEQTKFFEQMDIPVKIETLSDTRFDRIADIVAKSLKFPILRDNIIGKNDFVIVAGSSWQPGEDLILGAYNDIMNYGNRNVKLVLVPHEPTKSHIASLTKKIDDFVLLSEYIENPNEDYSRKSIVVVDSIGKLLQLYASADAAYIGGGFGVGIHSVTEPAGYGLPLSTGPKIENSPDATQLHEQGAISIVENSEAFSNWVKLLIDNPDEMKKLGRISHDFVHTQKGSSKSIAQAILKHL